MTDQAEEQSNEIPELDVLDQPEEESDKPETPETPEDQPEEESSFEDEFDKLEQDLNPENDAEKTETDEPSEPEQGEPATDEKELKETSPDTFVTEIDGKEVELVEAKFPNGEVGYIPKGVKAELLMQADYTRKTQELSVEKEKITQWEQDKKFFEYSLLVNEIGQPPLPTLYDAYADENGTVQEVKDPTTGEVIKRYRVFNDPKEKAMADIELEKFYDKLNNYKSAKQNADTKNEQLINNFKTKSGKDDTYITELLTKVKPYLNTTVARGLEPFPEDALEFFDKAVNFDKILADKLKDEKTKLLKDLDTKDSKSKTEKQITPKRQAPPKKTDLYDDIEEMVKSSY